MLSAFLSRPWVKFGGRIFVFYVFVIGCKTISDDAFNGTFDPQNYVFPMVLGTVVLVVSFLKNRGRPLKEWPFNP